MAAAEEAGDDGGLSISNRGHFYVDAEGFVWSSPDNEGVVMMKV
jgi:hypothetical protein